MSDVVFEEENDSLSMPSRPVQAKQKLTLSEQLVKNGFAKSVASADRILIGFAGICLVVAGFVLVRFAFPPPHHITPQEQAEIIRMTSGNTQSSNT